MSTKQGTNSCAGGGGFNIFTGEPISVAKAVDPTRPPFDDMQANRGPGHGNDKSTMPQNKLQKCEIHEKEADEKSEEAKHNFFSRTNLTEYDGGKGKYHIRAFISDGENSELGHSWPMAFVGGESQTVNAAMWFKDENADAFLLVSVWTFSATGDKNKNYYKDEYSKDIFAFCGKWASGTNWNSADWENHFSVAQDYWTEHFYCAPLEVISVSEMSALELLNPNPTPAGPK